MKQLLFFILLCPLWLIGQYSGTVHYTVRDGLPSSTVYSITQDSKGFIWMGTEAGLVRFDGAKFKVYTTLDGLPDNEALDLTYDSINDRLWIFCFSNRICYYRHGVIYTDRNDSTLRQIRIGANELAHGTGIHTGGQFFFVGNTIYKYNEGKASVSHSKSSYIYHIHMWNDSTYDIMGAEGMEIYKQNRLLKYWGINKGYTPYIGFWFDSVLIAGIKDSLFFYARKSNGDYSLKKAVNKGAESIISTIVTSGRYYVLSIVGKGVYLLDTSLRYPMQCMLRCNANKLFKDRNGDIWVSARDVGVYLLKQGNAVTYTTALDDEHNNINAIAVDAGHNIYMGNSVGEVFAMDSGYAKQLVRPIWRNTEKIRNIIPVGSLLYFTTDGGFYKRNIDSKKIGCKLIFRDNCKAILYSKSRQGIIGGTVEGVFFYKDTIQWAIRKKRVTAMAERFDGDVIYGAIDGVYKINNGRGVLLDTVDDRMKKRVISMTYTPDSLLWIGTASDGIMVFNGRSVCCQVSSINYPVFAGRICRKVQAGRNGEVWIATNAGVNKIRYHYRDSLVIDNITPITVSDGLPSDDVNDILLQDSTLYIATSKGLTLINERELARPKPAPVYILSVRINNSDSIVHKGTYVLSHAQNNLTIEYTGVSYRSDGQMRYRYRVQGSNSNNDWQVTTNTSIELRALSPGSYVFEVAALDKFGVPSAATASVSILIIPAFYQAIWFWAIVFILALCGGLYLIRRGFIKRQKEYEREQKQNNKIIELEQQALKAQMNPHFIFNCLAAIQHFVNTEDVYSANMYLSNFARLIRKTLDFSGEQYISLDKEIAYIENYIELEKMRFQDKFSFKIEAAKDINVYTTMIPPMLLQPIIENAIRHGLRYREGNGGVLSIAFNKVNGNIICYIDDNGIGIRRSNEWKSSSHVEYQSKGMTLTGSRINAINMISAKKINMEVKDKYDEKDNSLGTLVVITFEQ